MIDDAGRHEERGLEGRVVDDMEDRGDGRQRTAEAQENGDEPEMTDRRIGEESFQILLKNREIGAEQERCQSRKADDPEPGFRAGHHRPEPHEQEHAGLHHRCRMQIGRNRRRGRHRVRQPEMEGELGALRQRPEQDEDKHRAIERMVADRVARGEDRVEFIAADDLADDYQADEHGEAARAGNRQRHAGAVAGVCVMVPIADQQEGDDAGQLPEDGEQNEVAGKDDAQHRAHEGKEQREKARDRVLLGHIVAGIKDDENADRRDQRRKKPGEAVHPEGEVQPEFRNPVDPVMEDAARGDVGIEAGGHQEADKRDRTCEPGYRTALIGREEDCNEASREGDKNENRKQFLRVFDRFVSLRVYWRSGLRSRED